MFTPQAVASYVTAALLTVLNLLVAYLILRRFLFKPVLGMLARRRQLITTELDLAANSIQQADEKLLLAENSLVAANKTAEKILNDARNQARQQSEALLAEARDGAAILLDQAKAEADQLHQEIINEAHSEITDLAMSITARLIGQVMDEKLQRDLLDKYLAEAVPGPDEANSHA